MLNINNFLLLTDSYKVTQNPMQPDDTDVIYSYFESRAGAEFDFTEFFGLQVILKKHFVGIAFTQQDIEEAALVSAIHFGDESYFNREGWEYVLNEYNGHLPIEIRAVQEGLRVPTGNVLLTIRNTGDKRTRFLVPHVETIITHTWFSSTVATKSRHIKDVLQKYGAICGYTFIDFHLHDFGMRGTSSMESAGIGGLAHIVNFMGTDTLNALLYAVNYYGADLKSLAFSVAASEHCNATARGKNEGEEAYIDRLLTKFPNGILSMVADSYDIVRFVDEYIRARRDVILARYEAGLKIGKLNRLVIRPDSPRFKGDTPWAQVLWLHELLKDIFGTTINEEGYEVLHPCIGVIYGDGLSTAEIEEIYSRLVANKWSISNCVVGQGGGLLQKVNRDTQRFAFKCSAQQLDDGSWIDVQKEPLDKTKASKKGRLKLVKNYDLAGDWKYETISGKHPLFYDFPDELEVVFLNGILVRDMTFDQVRENSNLPYDVQKAA